jgi:hypothetical protein
MSLGSRIRGLLGERLSRRVGHWYRAAFVDMDEVGRALARAVPANAFVLDIGGGDGAPLNYLLALRDDIRVTSIDLAPQVGQWLEARFAARVTRLSQTSLADYLAHAERLPDAILMVDVMHHIPVGERATFLATLASMLKRSPALRLIIKDVEPGSPRARAGYWADRYITGDRSVSPIGRRELISLVTTHLGPLRHEETALYDRDSPNYAISFFR